MLRRDRLGSATQYGAAGFAVGLAAAGVIYGLISIYSRQLNSGIAATILPFALAGAIGGGMIGATRGRARNILRGALATAIALGTGYLLSNILSSYLLVSNIPDELEITFAYVARFALIGAWAGILLAAAQRDWDRLGTLALAGARGFALGAFVLDRLGQVLTRPMTLLVPGYIGDPAHDSLALAITWGISFAAAGIIAGAALGYALDHKRIKRMAQ